MLMLMEIANTVSAVGLQDGGAQIDSLSQTMPPTEGIERQLAC